MEFLMTLYSDVLFLLSGDTEREQAFDEWAHINKTKKTRKVFVLSLCLLCLSGCGLIKEPPTNRLMRTSHVPGVDVQCFMSWEGKGYNFDYGHPTSETIGNGSFWARRVEPNVIQAPLWTAQFNDTKDWPDFFMCLEREHATTGRVIWRGAPYAVPIRTDDNYAYYRLQ